MLLPLLASSAASGVRATQYALLAASHKVKGYMADIATAVCCISMFFRDPIIANTQQMQFASAPTRYLADLKHWSN
jgi:hypothetical protein